MLHFRILLCCCFVVLLSGCALIPRIKESGGSEKSAQDFNSKLAASVTKVVDTDPPPALPNIKVSADGVTEITMPRPASHSETRLQLNSAAAESSRTEEAWYSRIKIPLWVNLLGLAIAIPALIMALKYARNSSPAIAAAYGSADLLFSKAIKTVEAHFAANADDAETRATISHINTALSDARGTLAAQAPPKKI